MFIHVTQCVWWLCKVLKVILNNVISQAWNKQLVHVMQKAHYLHTTFIQITETPAHTVDPAKCQRWHWVTHWIGPTPFSGSWQRCVLVGWQTGDIGSSSCRCRVADVNNGLTSFVHNHNFHTNTLVKKRFPRHLGKFSCTCLPSVSIHKGDGGWGGGGMVRKRGRWRGEKQVGRKRIQHRLG